MKKLLLFAVSALLAMPTMAQEDVTNYIQNAGFDEDLTFEVDGSMKEAISTTTSLSERSWAYIAADSTVYARPKSTSSQNRPDGRKLEAVNGFIGRVNGWEIITNQAFPKCEWVYFGTVPYDLASQAVPIADDGSTYLEVPARPDAYSSTDNKAFAYLRAGWGGRAVYKQSVKLPCARYRLEYWAININPSGTNGKNLSKVTCRKDTWEDETGFTDQQWTLHTIEFLPLDEFSMEFGFESSGGSGSNPFLCIDGIKLYKIGEADPIELLQADIYDMMSDADEMASQAIVAGYSGLADQIVDFGMEVLDALLSIDELEELKVGVKDAKAQMDKFQEALNVIPEVDAILSKMDNLLQTTNFDGKAEFEAAYLRILGYKENGQEEGVDVCEQILGAVAEATAAIKAYYLTQKGSVDNPADFTLFIQHPWFINTDAEPVYEDDMWVFPKAIDEEGVERYTEGSVDSPDLNSEGWYIAGASGGDQRLNWQRGRSCWNAWNNNFTTTLAVGQDLEGLPNGYYTVAADLCTQTGCLNDQHVFAESIAEKKISSTLTSEGWDYNEWETVSMNADQKVLVIDGKLTIGAEGTGTGSGATGWFLATNFRLFYLGEAPAEAVKQAFDAKIADAQEYAAKMHFAVDKKTLNDAIAQYANATDYIEALNGLAAAMKEAQASEAKYEEYIPADGTTEGKTIPTVQNTLKKNGGSGYAAAEEIVQFAYDYVMNWIACDTASYVYFDATVNHLKDYVNTYTPAFNHAAEVAAVSSEKGKAALQDIMNAQKAVLISEIKEKATIDEFIADLNSLLSIVVKQNIVDNPKATDYTAFIINPNAEAENGWEFDKGNGNTNTTSGQWYDGSSTRYFDSYNANGLVGYIAKQLVKDLPNGTYNVGVVTRTPAEGAYVFCAPAEGQYTWLEIPLNYYMAYDEETGEEVQAIASDTHGPIWEEAQKAVEDGTATDQQMDIYNANNGNGRGWQRQQMKGIVVNNHELLIGTAAGSEELGTPKVFAGNWYSVGEWTLTLVALGDNTGWAGPIETGIDSMGTQPSVADGIYSISGVRTNKLQRGLNIVVVNGQTRKVMIK